MLNATVDDIIICVNIFPHEQKTGVHLIRSTVREDTTEF